MTAARTPWGRLQRSRDLQADASLPLRAAASLAARAAGRVRMALLEPGFPLALRATDPMAGVPSRASLDALRAAAPPVPHASLREPERTRALIQRAAPGHVDAVIAAAERVLRGEVRLLGQRWTGSPPDWHLDPVLRLRWDPAVPGRRVLTRPPRAGADPKHPWDLSRFQFALPLVQAWWLTREPRFAQHYLDLVEDWIAANPFPRGINWAMAMDVALRAFSWVYALWHLRDAPALDVPRWRRWWASLRDHHRYVRLCLEWGLLGNSNHYLADVLGLAALEVGVPGLGSRGSVARQARRLARETLRQTLRDGANAECATGYHRFVTEMFLHGVGLGLAPGAPADALLRRQLEYLAALTREDGSMPAIGDNDDGRVLPIDPDPVAPARSVLDLGHALLFNAPRREASGGPAPDLLWIGGEPAFDSWSRAHAAPRSVGWRSFEEAGIHVRADGGWHVTASSGPRRTSAGGGHIHGDVLGIVVHVGGVERVRDPGTLSYAAGPVVRDRFRSAAFHSTVSVEGVEPRPLLRQFRTGPGLVAEATDQDGELSLELELAPGCRMRRRIRLDPQRGLQVEDEIEARPPRVVEVGFMLGPPDPRRGEPDASGIRIEQSDASGMLTLECEAMPPLEGRVEPVELASGYGIPLQGSRVRVRGTTQPGQRVTTRISFTPVPDPDPGPCE